MSIWRLVAKEILHRKITFAMGLCSVALAVACLVGALTLLDVYDAHTAKILEAKEAETSERMAALEDEMRRAMLNLGFNIVILPQDQNLADWYAEDYASKYMPEEYVTRLATSNIVTVRHLLPSLQQKIRWPEQKRTIILIGTRGEVPNAHKSPLNPLIQPVPKGKIVLGYELHDGLGLKVGDKVTLLGQGFEVHRCHDQRGSKDDITAWIDLDQAQALLEKDGLINAILALECKCAWADLAKVREEIGAILPETQIIEQQTKALARAEARTKVAAEAQAALAREKAHRNQLRGQREELAAILVPLVMVACAVWIGLLALGNVRQRRSEIGILRAIGFRSKQILLVFLSKAFAMGLLGGAVGLGVGFLAGKWLGAALDSIGAEGANLSVPFNPQLALLALVVAPLLAALASWIPALLAAQQDPAETLREE